eukprot:jgi/Chlat1/4463/Chrsp29S04567
MPYRGGSSFFNSSEASSDGDATPTHTERNVWFPRIASGAEAPKQHLPPVDGSVGLGGAYNNGGSAWRTRKAAWWKEAAARAGGKSPLDDLFAIRTEDIDAYELRSTPASKRLRGHFSSLPSISPSHPPSSSPRAATHLLPPLNTTTNNNENHNTTNYNNNNPASPSKGGNGSLYLHPQVPVRTLLMLSPKASPKGTAAGKSFRGVTTTTTTTVGGGGVSSPKSPATTAPPPPPPAAAPLEGVTDPVEAEAIARIRTGDDVVEFYAQYGQESAVKFFYCIRADTGLDFRPYDLAVVPREALSAHAEHFTLSASGVVRVVPPQHNNNNTPHNPHHHTPTSSEFTPLGEWVREKSLFGVLRRMRFFKHYLVDKMFRIWHKGVRNRLTRRLFLAKPTFCGALMELRGLVHDLSEIRMMHVNQNHLYSLDEFAELQQSHRTHKATPALEAAVERIQSGLERICREVSKQARLYKESIRDASELEDVTGVNLLQGQAADKTRSMVSIKHQKMERARTYRRVTEEAKMLGEFIRLADYMLVEGLVARAIGTAEELLALLESPRVASDKASKGVFLTMVSFAEEGLAFSPTEVDVLAVLNNNLLEGMISTIQGVPRLLFMRSFVQYFDAKLSGLNPVAIIRATDYFAQLRVRVDKVVSQDFAEALQYAQIFEENRDIYTFGKTWRPEAHAAEKHTLKEFRDDLYKQKEWRNDLERMKIGAVIGVLHVDSKSLRNSLVPITLRTLESIKGLLLQSAREETVKALSSFQSRIKLLQERPLALDEFVTFMEAVDETVSKRRLALMESAVVDDMYDLLTSFEVKAPTADQVKLDDLHDAVAAYQAAVVNAEEYITDRKGGMMNTLDKQITAINEELLSLLGSLHSGPYVEPDSLPSATAAELHAVQEGLGALGSRAGECQRYQRLFGMPVDDFANLALTQKECTARLSVWSALSEFIDKAQAWKTGPLQKLRVVEIQADVEQHAKDAYRMGKANKEDRVVYRLKDAIDEFKTVMPLIEELANEALGSRHWQEIFRLVNQHYEPGQPFSVTDLQAYGIANHMDAVAAISLNASKEHSLERALDKMSGDWSGLEFRVVAYKDTGTFVMGGVDEVQALLDDQIVKIQSMRASPFIKPFEARASTWEDMLQTLQDLVDNWLACQATWQYLEPIFGSADILKQMPEEGEQFRTVDTIWRDMMAKTNKAPACITIARDKERLARLKEANNLLDAIQKGLASYLEQKRVAFPRFFFLSNDEMLEILSETKDPTRVQPHLKKCFEGIDSLRFEEKADTQFITAIVSAEGEAVDLKDNIKPAAANGAVEKWLLLVESGMVECIQNQCELSVAAYATVPREEWVLAWPGQVVLVVSAIYWTQQVTAAVNAGNNVVSDYERECTDSLGRIVSLVRGDLTKLARATLSALVVMDVHARDVVAMLSREGVGGVGGESGFAWQSQLRMYWENGTCIVRMMNASVEYGYEYLGNSSRLTETTKDLAKALARQCVVFNCSDSLDYLAMAKFFKGLAASGAWACFDEFNRIDLEVLSVVAQQVLEIQIAVQQKVKTFTFEGTELTLKPTCNVFITMNPGYAGRSELPDNLKALFRTVAMMVPDYAMISEIILYSNGYLQARDCARKIVATYRLCSEQLSSQDHYDYGMRAVMAVLRAAANLKRRFPSEDEYVLMLRSIIDVNLCKFLSHDVPLFNGIVKDLFPGVVLPSPDYVNLDNAMRANCKKMNLQPTDYFLTKVIQLYEMIVVRHGLMLVGLPFSGKTSASRVLASSLSDLADAGLNNENRVKVTVINPKGVTMGQLYGQNDPATQEWCDGVLAVKFRAFASEQWLILDGPVDAIWIENMNTVLDDNKKLCLPNSEIIQMSSTMNMIFEVGDLAVASPATVSRCGMVYLEPHQLGWRPLVQSWLATFPTCADEHTRRLDALFEWLLPAASRFVRTEVKEISPTLDANIAQSLMRMFAALYPELLLDESTNTTTSDPQAITQRVDATFVFALTWSAGATGDVAGRKAWDVFVRRMCIGGAAPEGYEMYVPNKHATLVAPMVPDDNGALVHDYFWDKDAGAWKTWTSTIAPVDIPSDAQFSEIIIPTADSTTYTFLLQLAIGQEKPILFAGATGTGKSVYIKRHLMSGLAKEKYSTVAVAFSARTSANMTQEQIDGKLDKRRKGVFGPPAGKKCVIFVDDLNMPQLEPYGAQPPIELLRQFMDYGGWYARDNSFREMVDVNFVAAMGPPGGGRNNVTSRYLRHFNTVAVSQVADTSLLTIFTSILNWHLNANPFPTEVRALTSAVTAATLEVYSTSVATLLPTPTKSHYIFNLRDFARVVQGVMLHHHALLPAESGVQAAKQFARLWTHEVLRVFYDRLTDDKDRKWLLDTVKTLTKKHFFYLFDELFGHLKEGENGSDTVDMNAMRRCFFGAYMDEDQDASKYGEVQDITKLLAAMEEYLKDYNGTSKRPMNLAIFLFAAEHVSRICRLLLQPGGHMLLVGVGGSGRQSLTRLASHMCGMQVLQVEISKSYGMIEWREDLKRMLRVAGEAAGSPAVFLFSDTQIKNEAFVEDINNVLNAGEVPNMFANDEKAIIIENVRTIAAKAGRKLETQLELWAFFVERCRARLHIVICMSPVGDAFRERLRQYPSLVNCCTIDWFQEWPTDALEAVAQKFLKEVDLESSVREGMVRMCKTFHDTVRDFSGRFYSELGRRNYVTPTSYLELISTFQTLLTAKRKEVMKLKQRYETGLQKLASSAEEVAGMSQELVELKPKLIETVGEVEELMRKIDREKIEVVEPKKAVVQADEAVAAAQAAEAKAIKDDCESALAEAMPALKEALSALDTLKPADINYVKSLKNPPSAVKLVMEAVCVILDVKPVKVPDGSGKMAFDYWKPSVALLNDKEFLNTLKAYDKDNIPPKIIDKIRSTYLTNEEFTPERAANASAAAEGLCKWVNAMSKYDAVAKVVAPKQAQLKIAEAAYEKVMVALRAKQAELKEVLDKLAAMEAQLAANMAKKENLQHEVGMCTVKLERAEKLIGGLGGEKVRWTEAAHALGHVYTNLTGDILVSAGVISYLGAFTAGYRQAIIEKWVALCEAESIPRSRLFSLNAALGNPVAIREWLIAGLPNDSFSIDNAIVVANARRWPLMIDPQGQANKWVKNMERANNLQVIKLSEGGEYIRTLENAIQFGLPVLLENVGEELDPTLEPLLLKQVFKSGGMNCIRLGDATIEYSSDFRFYMTTKLRNPHYLPETAVKVTLLNFMITKEGLSDQMLGVVVAKERPDLEQQKNELVVQGAENKRKLKEIEDKILEVLSGSEGNILEDETAIKIISEAKVLGNDINAKQALAEQTEKEIDAARVGYKAGGDYAATLFFCISDLANIEPMYQYSLPWFVNLYVLSITNSAKAEEVADRLANINTHFTFSLYCNVCRSLFEKDKLLFAFLLCSRIMETRGDIDPAEWMFLLTGGIGTGGTGFGTNPNPEWLIDRSWTELCRLSVLSPAFTGLAEGLRDNPKEWKELYDSTEPHLMPLPGGGANNNSKFSSLNPIQKLLVLRCVRPDKVVPAVQDFVVQAMGRKFVEPPVFDLGSCYADSSATCPLIFVLSVGSDPMAALLKFAEAKGMMERMQFISLGQGQGPKASALIKDAIEAGSWVVLQNCHLAPSWMPSLEKICEEINPDTVNVDFRLWMTSYPSPKFPVAILQNGVKMTNEPPKGIRANIKRSYGLDPISNDDFFEGSTRPHVFKKLLFGLTFFHAVVQERRKFGPLGFNIPYGFDDGDLRISVRQLRMLIDEAEGGTPFAALNYITSECNYGGRVTDDKDRILIKAVLENVYCAEILEQDYKFSSSGLYYAPDEGDRDSFVRYIESLPIAPLPEAFGLHANADITKDVSDTNMMFSSLLSMSSTSGSGKGGAAASAESAVAGVVKDILATLPPDFDLEAALRRFPVLYEESMNTMLCQEMARFNRLTACIRKSLQSIEKALQGLVVMSSDLETAFRSLIINQVPAMWGKLSYPSLKPLGSYVKDLLTRLSMLQTWYERGSKPSVFWLSGFFFAQSFMTAALQNYARKNKIPIDMVGFDFDMLGMDPDAYKTGPEDGVYIRGLYVEGCAWDEERKMLCESKPKILHVPAPVMWLKPALIVDFAKYPHYDCPLYRTAERKGVLATTGHSTNFVMKIRMPTDQPPSLWTMRGVAMLCALSD